jgi:hypothetical protein
MAAAAAQPAPSTADLPGAVPPASPPPGPTGPSRAEVLLDKGARVTGRGARVIVHELSERRGLRTVLLGGVITLIALDLGSDSALSAPLLVIGVIMLIVGAMGPRLRGHIGLDFGPEGTAITMHTHVAPPGRRLAAQAEGERAVIALPPRPRIALVPNAPEPAATASATPEPADAQVVESTGETVEIDVAQLRALLDAQDRADGRSAG